MVKTIHTTSYFVKVRLSAQDVRDIVSRHLKEVGEVRGLDSVVGFEAFNGDDEESDLDFFEVEIQRNSKASEPLLLTPSNLEDIYAQE